MWEILNQGYSSPGHIRHSDKSGPKEIQWNTRMYFMLQTGCINLITSSKEDFWDVSSSDPRIDVSFTGCAECVSFSRLYRPELSILQAHVRQSKDELFYFSDYTVRGSLIHSFITKSLVHEDMLGAFFTILDPVLKETRVLARVPMIASMILASANQKYTDLLKDEVQSTNARCVLFPTFVSPNGICTYGEFGNHWVLLSLDIENQSWNLYDSFAEQNPLRILRPAKENMMNLARSLGVLNPVFNVRKCTRQENGIDCGIHVCANALGVLFDLSVNPFPVHANDLRIRIYTMLLLVAEIHRDCRGQRSSRSTLTENDSMLFTQPAFTSRIDLVDISEILVINSPWSIIEYTKAQEFPNGSLTTLEGTVHTASDILPHPGYGRVKSDNSSQVTFIRASVSVFQIFLIQIPHV